MAAFYNFLEDDEQWIVNLSRKLLANYKEEDICSIKEEEDVPKFWYILYDLLLDRFKTLEESEHLECSKVGLAVIEVEFSNSAIFSGISSELLITESSVSIIAL